MKNVLLIPDSFKGTMSSQEICSIMERQILGHYPDAVVTSIPVADGGEGSVDAFLAAAQGNGEKREVTVQGPFGSPMKSFYGIIDGGRTAVIEMAACAGLPLVGDSPDPCRTTTYGAGELIRCALDSGCSKIIMGLGGSCTNDGGCGAAAALGAVFTDKAGEPFVPAGGTLKDIARIDLSGVDKRLSSAELVTMCDIDNPLYGENGAAYIFGPQKGADADTVRFLDAGLRNLAAIVREGLGVDAASMPGAGAAGGMGYGMKVFLGSRLQMGIETVLDTVGFDRLLEKADFVFTGEGKIDTQSLRGKVVIGVARRAVRSGVPVIAVVGDIGDGIEAVYGEGVSAVFSINRVAVDFHAARPRAKSDLALTMDTILRFSKICSSRS